MTAELDILKKFPAEGGQSVLRDRVMGVGGTSGVRFDSSPCFRLSCVVCPVLCILKKKIPHMCREKGLPSLHDFRKQRQKLSHCHKFSFRTLYVHSIALS